MIENIYNIFFGILGMNMVIVGAAVVIVPIITLVKKQRGVSHIRTILYLVVGPLLIYYGVYLARNYLWH